MADILLLGANGYSGRLTARYLLEHPHRDAWTLALAARSRDKVESAKLPLDELVRIWEVDVTDEHSVEQAVRQVTVVINCVGPFWIYGWNVVKACVRHGKHYVDISGEVPYVFELINLYDFQAAQNHSIIIPACAFDSVPSDTIVYLANKTLKSRYPNAEIEDCVTGVDATAVVASGSFRTLFAFIESVPSNIQRFARAPFALSPVHGGPSHPTFRFLYNLPAPMSSVKGGVFIMAAVNRAIVERTWGLQQFQLVTSSPTRARNPSLAYGPRFRYDEFLVRPSTFSAILLSISVAITGLSLLFLPPVRWLAKLFVGGSGQGPSESTILNGHMEYTNVTTAVDPAKQKTIRIRSTLRGEATPLYLSSVMVAEAALALLKPAELPALAREGGVLTPMSGLGDALVSRLQQTGLFSFSSEFVDEEQESAKSKQTSTR